MILLLCRQIMRRSQEFGFQIENHFRVLCGLSEKKNDTCIHDISKAENPFDPEENISIKTVGNNSIDCGDVLRLYDYNYAEKHTMIIFRYKQVAEKRVIKEIIEVIMNEEFKRVMFGSAARSQIEALVKYVKGIPKNQRSAEEAATYKKMAKDLRESAGGLICYAPKVDTKSQRRVQCSIRNLNEFMRTHPELIKDKSIDTVRGKKMTLEFDCPKRIRNKAEKTVKTVATTENILVTTNLDESSGSSVSDDSENVMPFMPFMPSMPSMPFMPSKASVTSEQTTS
jgi:hypothetical protein